MGMAHIESDAHPNPERKYEISGKALVEVLELLRKISDPKVRWNDNQLEMARGLIRNSEYEAKLAIKKLEQAAIKVSNGGS